MDLSKLTASLPKKKASKRVGCGIASGKGKTCGRGYKGQNSRSGNLRNAAFGGDSRDGAWWRKMPKLRGLGNDVPVKTRFEVIKLSAIEAAGLKEVSPVTLFDAGLIKGARPIKVLFDSAPKGKFTFDGVAFSKKVGEFAEAAVDAKSEA